MAKMTEISRSMTRDAIRIRSSAEAVAYLKDNPPFRSIKDVLIAADKLHLPEKELKKRIVNGICLNQPQKNRESMERTVNNWFNGKTRSLKRDKAFELCLILDLSLKEANHFMLCACDEAIHWRDPQEIAWGYAIEHKLTYAQTMELLDEVKAIASSKAASKASDVMTQKIRKEVLENIQGTKEELLAFIAQGRDKWGTFHNEAYRLFVRYMDILEIGTSDKAGYEQEKKELEEKKKKNGGEQMIIEEKLSVETVLNTYFFSRWISSGAQSSSLHKSIRLNWPDEASLSKMRNRADGVDVSRKVLIMLFLATNGSETAQQYQSGGLSDQESYEEYDEGFEENQTRTREQVFKDMYARINLMLSRCGFRELDPRSPFDWIVLHSICVKDVTETDQRLNEILSGLFCEETGGED